MTLTEHQSPHVAELLLDDVAPAEVAPTDLAPAEVAPTDLAPTDLAPADQAVQLLIPEARQHQRRRHRIIAVVGAALAALIGIVVFASGAGPGSSRSPGPQLSSQPGSLVSSPVNGPVTVRPVVCFAPPYAPTASAAVTAPLPTSCPAQYRVNGIVPNPGAQGYSSNNAAEDPALAGYPSTPASSATPKGDVLLGLIGAKGAAGSGQRYVLGPVQFVLSPHAAIASARAVRSPTGQVEIKIVFTVSGSARWDATARADFHQQMAFVFNGKVVTAPLIEPTESGFSSFNGRSVVSGGNLTMKEARQIAAAL
jgi:hypothetical protein